MDFLLSIFPALCILFTLLVLRWPLWKASGTALVFTGALALFHFGMTPEALLESTLKGSVVAFTIVAILFGAIFFIRTLHVTGSIVALREDIHQVTTARVPLAVFVSWAICGFMEVASGFGTPVLIGAPILVELGFTAELAAILTLIGTSTWVPYGALSVPLTVGMAGADASLIAQSLVPLQIVFCFGIPFWIAFLVDRNEWKSHFPFLLFTGVLSAAGFYSLKNLNIEVFPVLTASIVSIALFLWVWVSGGRKRFRLRELFPFWGMPLFLLGTRQLFLWGELKFLPAYPLLALSLISLFLLRKKTFTIDARQIFQSSIKSMGIPTLTLIFLCTLTQWIRSSSMVVSLGAPFRNEWMTLTAPWLGAFGTLTSGSSTVSNLLMYPIHVKNIEFMHFPLYPMLALQALGSAFGIMLSLSTLLSLRVALGIKTSENKLFQKSLPYCLFILLTLSALGFTFFG